MAATLPKFEFFLSATFCMLCFFLSIACAERDFNFNDSQVSLLEPKDEPNHKFQQDPYAAEVAHCHYTENEIVLSLVLKKHDWSDMSDNKKSKVLEKLSKFFAIPKEFIVLESVTKRDLYDMQKQSIRKGNNKCHSNRRLGRVDFMLGCGTKYFSMGEPIANQIGQQMKDGSIDNISGEKFGWWIIWRKDVKTRAERNRRQAIEGSGEDDYDNDDDYDYDEDEEDTIEPVTEIPATTTHAHRHHHGAATKPDLTDTSNELTNNADAVAGNALNNNNNNDNDQQQHGNTNNNQSNKPQIVNNLDEEIVESVSQLESVITKTIENTKHIKELPVLVDVPSTSIVVGGGDDDDVAVEEEEDGVDDEIVAAINVDNENGEPLDMQTNRLTETELHRENAAEIATTTIPNINSMTPKISLDSQLEAHHHDAHDEVSSSVNVTEVIESSASLATVTFGLDQTTTATATATATTTTASNSTPPFSTLLTNSNNKLSLPPQFSPHSPLSSHHLHNYDTSSSVSSVVVVNSTLSSLLTPSTTIQPPPSSSSSSALSSSMLSKTTTTTTTAMQSKHEPKIPSSSSYDENVDSTMWPISSEEEEEDDVDNNAGTEVPIIAFATSTTITTTTASSNTLTTINLSTERKLINLTIIEPMSTATTTTITPRATLAITTTTEPTEYINSVHQAKKDGENTPPTLVNRLQKFVITSGKEFRFIVPADTFFDSEEDQSNLLLGLTDEVGHILKATSWLQFNPETREIYGLPVIDTLYKYKYRLTATDSGNLTVTEIVEIEVTKHRGEPLVNHEISVAVKINDKNVLSVDWQLQLIRAIASILGDDSTAQVVVREIRQTPYDPTAATLVYFNQTLPTNECPDALLNSIVQHIDKARLADLVNPTLDIKSITGQLIGPCQFFVRPTTPKTAESSIETSSIWPSSSGSSTADMLPTTSTSGSSTSTTSLPDTTAGGGSYTDYGEPIEPKVENTPPEINKRLDKFALTSGKAFRFIVPAETFNDAEDKSNLRLGLTDINGHELPANSWLHLNAETKEIYGLPVDTDTHKYEYLLTATDSGNLTVAESIQVNVQQYSRVRSANHEVYIAIKLNDKNVLNLDWQMKLIRAIATTLGDESTTNLVVREIRPSLHDPASFTFVYYNETLPISECPDAELNSLIQRIDVRRLSDLVYPTLSIKSITGQLINACQKDLSSTKMKPTYTSKNEPPKVINQVDRVNATVNQLLVYKVPEDTFNHELKLSLRTKDNQELDPRNWLQFDSKNNEFYGIPKSADVGTEEYLLVAEDSNSQRALDALMVFVSHSANTPRKEFTAYFKVYLAIRNDQFNSNLQRKLFERLAQLFGDPSTDLIALRSIVTPHDSDSTIVNFYNTTLQKSNNRCHEEEIEAIRNVYFDGQNYLRERVKKILGSELNVTQIQIMPTMGSCYPNVNHHDIIPTKTEEPTLKSTFAEDYMFTFILPAVIIIGLIIIAAIIACCLHHRRMSGKMELGDEEERKSFRPKGIPVIFQDELDEKPESGNKSPIILKNEKPPLLPPSYNTSNMNGDNDVDEYVPPPAVVVGGREIRGKSPATPSYRKPPPYVSP